MFDAQQRLLHLLACPALYILCSIVRDYVPFGEELDPIYLCDCQGLGGPTRLEALRAKLEPLLPLGYLS